MHNTIAQARCRPRSRQSEYACPVPEQMPERVLHEDQVQPRRAIATLRPAPTG